MAYVLTKDYLRVIQPTELKAITSNDASIRLLVEGSVKTEINSRLIQRWNTDREFQDFKVFDPNVIYKGTNRIYLDAIAYSATSTYALKALVLQAGIIYICTTAITIAEPFNASKWTALGNQGDLFFVTLPYPEFNVDTPYLKGDKVWWKDSVYTAQQDSVFIDSQEALQAPNLQSIVYGNVTPDDRINGRKFWGIGTPYQVNAGVLPTDTSKWTAGDNRNQELVEIFLDMVVYKLCKRIAPDNVPEARHNAWFKAVQDIKDFANGDVNAQLPIIQPKTGSRVAFGGSTPKNFDW